MADVISLAEHQCNSTLWTPEDALRDALATVQADGKWAGWPKLVVLALDDRDGAYHSAYVNAGMQSSEMLALLRVIEARLLKGMGY